MVNRYRRRTNFKTRKRKGRKNTRRRKSRRKTKRGGVHPGKRPAAPRKSFGKNSHRTKSLGILQQPSQKYPKGMLHTFKEKEKMKEKMKELSNIFSKSTLGPSTAGKTTKKKPKEYTPAQLAQMAQMAELTAAASKLQLDKGGPADATMPE